MIVYPHGSPIILNDEEFQKYGGAVDLDSTFAQRQAVYLIAEKQMSSHIGTFLLPTIVTGTFPWPGGQHLVLPYSHILSIPNVAVLSQKSICSCDFDESSGCAFIWDDTYGYIDVRQITEFCACSCGPAYQIRVVMQAGLPTGTANQADMLLGLTIAAEINLNRIIDPSANEGTGDIGIIEFSNLSYHEKRIGLKRTAFGNSAKANEIALLVKSTRKKRALKF
jgi:hypothetical protein